MRLPEVPSGARDQFDRAHSVVSSNLFYRAYKDFAAHDGTIYAAAITFYALLSLIPFVIFGVAILGIFIRDPDMQRTITDHIIGLLPADANLDEPIANAVSSVASIQRSLLGVPAILGAAWTASGVFGALRRALNRAFDVSSKRSFIRSRLTDVGSVIVLTLLLFGSTIATIVLSLIRARAVERFNFIWSNSIWSLVFLLVPIALSFLVFLLAFRWVPRQTLGVRDLWFGALLAAVGFEILKYGFAWYVATIADYDRVYGALGGLISFMGFVYFAAILVIFSAEVSREMASRRAMKREQSGYDS